MTGLGDPNPVQAKRRLPTDAGVVRPGAGMGAGPKTVVLLIYGAACVGMLGAAGYMLAARGAAATSLEVLAPGLGALWFLVRLLMVGLKAPTPPG